MTPLREIVDTIQESVARLEDDLKVHPWGIMRIFNLLESFVIPSILAFFILNIH